MLLTMVLKGLRRERAITTHLTSFMMLMLSLMIAPAAEAGPPFAFRTFLHSGTSSTCGQQAIQILEAAKFRIVVRAASEDTQTHFVGGENREASAIVVCTSHGKEVEVTLATAVESTSDRAGEYADWIKRHFKKF